LFIVICHFPFSWTLQAFKSSNAIDAANEALAASRIRMLEDAALSPPLTSEANALKDAALAECVERFARAVRDVETHRVAADGILERLQDASSSHLSGSAQRAVAEQARSDLDALYDARVVGALQDVAVPARQARAQALAERIADEAERDEQNSYLQTALIELRNLVRAASATSSLTPQERKDVKNASTADVVNVMQNQSALVNAAVCRACCKLHDAILHDLPEPLATLVSKLHVGFEVALRAEADASFSNYAMQAANTAIVSVMKNGGWPSEGYSRRAFVELGWGRTLLAWMRVLEEAQRRRPGAVTRASVLARIARADALLPLFHDDVRHLAADMRDATLADLARRGDDVASACATQLSDADAAGRGAGRSGVEGGGRRAKTRPMSPVSALSARKERRDTATSPSTRRSKSKTRTSRPRSRGRGRGRGCNTDGTTQA